ncbi:MAG: sugar phosphate isomerase/epimerase [Planctomycetota bacterium]|nr:sugar phosphate isomerase/epimerase [Planctomycetota bacterium]
MPIPLSITTDFRDDGGPIEPKLELFARAGFTHVHWCEHWSRDVLYEDFYIEGVARLLAKHGLRFSDTHNAETAGASCSAEDEAARKRGVRLLENRVRFTAALGGDCVVVHPVGRTENEEQHRARWGNLEKSFHEVAKLCERSRVRIGLENLPPGAHDDFHAFMEKFPNELLGFTYDSGHANMSKQPELLERYGPRLAALHLHDNHGEKDEHAIPGYGTVDWPRIAKAVQAAGYAKPVNFELSQRDAQRDPADFVREAYEKCAAFAQTNA